MGFSQRHLKQKMLEKRKAKVMLNSVHAHAQSTDEQDKDGRITAKWLSLHAYIHSRSLPSTYANHVKNMGQTLFNLAEWDVNPCL